MPFDGTGYQRRVDALDKMDQVIQLLGDKRRWCKRRLETSDGRRCIVGALMAVDAVTVLKKPIQVAIEQVTGDYYVWIEAFNDHPKTTHAVVMSVLQRARENIAKAEETASYADHELLQSFCEVFR